MEGRGAEFNRVVNGELGVFDKNSLDFEIVAAAKCTKATYPGDKARELLRLARLGLWAEQHAKPALDIYALHKGLSGHVEIMEALAAYPKPEPLVTDTEGCE